MFTIVAMLGVMFWLNWDFTLIAVGVTPFMLLMVSRFKKAVKKATHEVRKQQSNVVAVVQQGLESMRVVKAFGRQDLEQEELSEASTSCSRSPVPNTLRSCTGPRSNSCALTSSKP
ncbi:MAG: ABC transporter transmembrane domain-containing protein [Ramlibacter sp.]